MGKDEQSKVDVVKGAFWNLRAISFRGLNVVHNDECDRTVTSCDVQRGAQFEIEYTRTTVIHERDIPSRALVELA